MDPRRHPIPSSCLEAPSACARRGRAPSAPPRRAGRSSIASTASPAAGRSGAAPAHRLGLQRPRLPRSGLLRVRAPDQAAPLMAPAARMPQARPMKTAMFSPPMPSFFGGPHQDGGGRRDRLRPLGPEAILRLFHGAVPASASFKMYGKPCVMRRRQLMFGKGPYRFSGVSGRRRGQRPPSSSGDGLARSACPATTSTPPSSTTTRRTTTSRHRDESARRRGAPIVGFGEIGPSSSEPHPQARGRAARHPLPPGSAYVSPLPARPHPPRSAGRGRACP